MNEKYSIEDEAIMVQALSYHLSNDVWKKYVEVHEHFEVRNYWRNLFFDTLIAFSPIQAELMPSNIEFVNMVEKWIGKK